MRTEEEIRRAGELFDRYIVEDRLKRQGRDTQNNIAGVIACIQWVLGDEKDNPVAGTIRDLESHYGKTERN